jgi:hypothetical protein
VVRARKGRQFLESYHSRVSNGRDVLPNVDGRLLIARRYRDITSAIMVDQGGADQCSECRKQLIRSFAAAAALAEHLEEQLARGEAIDIQQHASLCSTMVSVARHLGVDQVLRRNVTLAQYLEEQEEHK